MSDLQTRTAGEVLQHHLESFGKGDVDAIMEDYTKESVVLTQDNTFIGPTAIRTLFTELTTNMLPPGSDFSMQKQEVHGDVAYIVWNAESETFNFSFATDTLVVKDGMITSQTFAGVIEPKG